MIEELVAMMYKSKSGLGLGLDLSPFFFTENGIDLDFTYVLKSGGLGQFFVRELDLTSVNPCGLRLDSDLRIVGLAHHLLVAQ